MLTKQGYEIGERPLPTWLRDEGQVHVAVITSKDGVIVGSSGSLAHLSTVMAEVEEAGGIFDVALGRAVLVADDGTVTEYVIDDEN